MLFDESGKSVWEAEYFSYGQLRIYKQDITFNIRLPGQYFDAESKLHYNKARYYDPVLGRYISSDPIGLAGGVNTYAYVGGNPVNYVDPTGEAAQLAWCFGGPVGCAAALGFTFITAVAVNGVNSRDNSSGSIFDGLSSPTQCNSDEFSDSFPSVEGPYSPLPSDFYQEPVVTTGNPDPNDPNNDGGDKYENPGHHDPRGGSNAANSSKSTLPRNHQELWNKSIRTNNKTRWAKEGAGKNATYHRFQNDGRGGPFHWNGSTSGARSIPQNQVPNKIIKL